MLTFFPGQGGKTHGGNTFILSYFTISGQAKEDPSNSISISAGLLLYEGIVIPFIQKAIKVYLA